MEDQKQFSTDNGQDEINNDKALPDLAIEKILSGLSVTERLRMERVDRFWSGKVWEHGWKGEKKLDYEVVFGGAQRVNRDAFTEESLVVLINRMKASVTELDIHSFNQAFRFLDWPNYGSLVEEEGEMRIDSGICPSLSSLPNLSKINLDGIDLKKAVPFLPETLKDICARSYTNNKRLSALAAKCPHLEAIDIGYGYYEIEVSSLNKFLLKYPSLKKLCLGFTLMDSGKLTSIGSLKALEEFEMLDGTFNGKAFGAMIENCKCLRRLKIHSECPVSKKMFCKLPELPNLVELVLPGSEPNVTDFVVRALSQCQKLEKLELYGEKALEDETIDFLADHSMSLVSFVVNGCKRISNGLLLPAETTSSHKQRAISMFREILPLFPDLPKIDIVGIDLAKMVPLLPTALREIRSSGPFNKKSLSALAAKCPHLEGIDFESRTGQYITVSLMRKFLFKYPCLKKLRLHCDFLPGDEPLSFIGALKQLEDFDLGSFGVLLFDTAAFEAMIEGCKQLRRLHFKILLPLHEQSLCKLATLSSLEELHLPGKHPNITDTVVKTISECQNLKKLEISGCEKITDASIVYLVEHAKTLILLDVSSCPLVTEKSLDAIKAEVIERHGIPPNALPEGPDDDGIFHFRCGGTPIDFKKAYKATKDNPWLKLGLNADYADWCDEDEEQLDEEEMSSSDEELDEEELSSDEELDEEELSSDEDLDEEELSGDEELDEEEFSGSDQFDEEEE